MKRTAVVILGTALALMVSPPNSSIAGNQTRVLQVPAKVTGMSHQNVKGAWLANGDTIVVEIAERTDATSSRPLPISVLKLVAPGGERVLSSFEGFFVNEVRSLGAHGGRERIELAGGVALRDGSRVYGKRIVEVDGAGRVETIWDSLRLPIEPGLEPSIQISNDGQFWVAAVGLIREQAMVGARVLAGTVGSAIPTWTSTINEEGAAWIGDAPDSDLEAVPLGPDLAAVLLRGRVFLVGPQGAKISRPVLRPTLGRGRMLSAFPEARLLVVYEEGTDALSGFQLDGDAVAPTGVAAPDFILNEKTVGARSFGPIGATSEGLVLATGTSGSSKPSLITVAISRQGGVRVLDRRVLPVSGKVDDIRLAADGQTVEWTERDHDHSQTLFRNTVTSLAH